MNIVLRRELTETRRIRAECTEAMNLTMFQEVNAALGLDVVIHYRRIGTISNGEVSAFGSSLASWFKLIRKGSERAHSPVAKCGMPHPVGAVKHESVFTTFATCVAK